MNRRSEKQLQMLGQIQAHWRNCVNLRARHDRLKRGWEPDLLKRQSEVHALCAPPRTTSLLQLSLPKARPGTAWAPRTSEAVWYTNRLQLRKGPTVCTFRRPVCRAGHCSSPDLVTGQLLSQRHACLGFVSSSLTQQTIGRVCSEPQAFSLHVHLIKLCHCSVTVSTSRGERFEG